MSGAESAPKRRGRKPLPAEAERSAKRPRSVRLGPAHWAELKRRGAAALEAWLIPAPYCDYCGGNDEQPQDHCADCGRPRS